MSAEKTSGISFRAFPDLRAKLEVVAAKEERSRINMFETLALNHFQREPVARMTLGVTRESGAER